MQKYISYVEIEEETEKRFYRICKNLEMNGISIIKNANSPEWNGELKRWGLKMKPLIEQSFLDPIWRTDNKNHRETRLIRTPPNVVIEEKKKGKKSVFKFKKLKSPSPL